MTGGQRTALAIVVAIGRNGEIGQAGQLPWRLPGDLARFRELTMGKPMIMGRRTFDSIGRRLPGRESIVVTRRSPADLPEGVHRAESAEAALALAETHAARMNIDEISLIGGATLFAEMMPRVDRLYVTYVDLAPQADTFFPQIDPSVWREVSRHAVPRQDRDEADYIFVDYVRHGAELGEHRAIL